MASPAWRIYLDWKAGWMKARRNSSPSDPNAPACPECDEPMVERTSGTGKFWGCSQYPSCTGLRNEWGESAEDVEFNQDGRPGPGY